MGAHALAVSTSNGWLVAGAGDGAWLVAALATRGLKSCAEPPVSRLTVAAGNDEYVVCALGDATTALSDVANGVRRILV